MLVARTLRISMESLNLKFHCHQPWKPYLLSNPLTSPYCYSCFKACCISEGYHDGVVTNVECDGAGDFMWIPATGAAGKIIWDEVGEEQFEREKVLLELEQECLQVYRRKVNSASVSRARLHQQLAQSEAEFTHLLLVLGERSVPARPEKMGATLKEQLNSIAPALRKMQLRKEERVKQFRLIQGQIHKISGDIDGWSEYNDSSSAAPVDENDLSIKKLEEYQNDLQRLQNEKSNRLDSVEKYIKTIKNLSAILGKESSLIITRVHPSLNELSGLSKNISDGILQTLDSTVKSLESEKQTRLAKLQQLGETLADLWNFLKIPHKDRKKFIHLSSLSSMVLENKCTPGTLTLEIIQQAETEVMRLDQLKASRMKELFFRKQIDLEEICSRSHMEVPFRPEMEKIIHQIDSGEINHADLLTSMDEQIARAEEEAVSRKAIMENVEKWILARDEELWLEEYSRDENRYYVSRGAHKNLRRAERARMMVNKIPALVDLLISKTRSWEDERRKVFLYDEVPLQAMLEEYNTVRRDKELEKQRQREQKKGQMKVTTDHESPFGARPGTGSRCISNKSLIRGISSASPVNRKLPPGLGPNSVSLSTQSSSSVKGQKANNQKGFADYLREDTASVFSSISGPFSP